MEMEQRHAKDGPPVPPAELLSLPHRFTPETLDGLQPQQMEDIRRIAAGEAPDVAWGVRARSLRAIAHLDGPEDIQILGRVVGDETEDRRLRAAAAVNLAYLTPARAEQELVQHLDVVDHRVQASVIQSLGMIGGPASYDALSAIDGIEQPYVQKQLVFARALVAYRHDLDADPLPFVKGVQRRQRPKEEMVDLAVRQIDAKKTGAALKLFDGSRYGIQLSERVGFQVTAGRALWTLFLNDRPAEEGLLKAIGGRKLILGLLSRWLMESHSFGPQYVVLSRPVDKGVEIMVVRTDGEVFYSGTAAVGPRVMSFMVSDVRRRGTAPTRVRGKLTKRGIEMQLTIPLKRRERKRVPVPIDTEEILARVRR